MKNTNQIKCQGQGQEKLYAEYFSLLLFKEQLFGLKCSLIRIFDCLFDEN